MRYCLVTSLLPLCRTMYSNHYLLLSGWFRILSGLALSRVIKRSAIAKLSYRRKEEINLHLQIKTLPKMSTTTFDILNTIDIQNLFRGGAHDMENMSAVLFTL